MKYPLVRELAADGFPVTVACRVLKFSTKNYYRWCRRPVTPRDLENAYLTNAAVDAHHDDPVFGYRFIADELERAGFRASERRVWRLCSEQEIFCSFSKRSKSSKRPGPAVHDDHVRRDFSASRPNEVWLSDITEHRTSEGKLYLCAIKDLYSNRIVGYALDERMKASLAVRALRNAIRLRDPKGTIVHSDRGSQGEFNRPSQHLDHGGVKWRRCESDNVKFSFIEDRFHRRVVRRWPGEQIGSDSGQQSRAVPRPKTPASRPVCPARWGSAGSATLEG
jgi:putative transposase